MRQKSSSTHAKYMQIVQINVLKSNLKYNKHPKIIQYDKIKLII
jgi:hypothetical protein